MNIIELAEFTLESLSPEELIAKLLDIREVTTENGSSSTSNYRIPKCYKRNYTKLNIARANSIESFSDDRIRDLPCVTNQ